MTSALLEARRRADADPGFATTARDTMEALLVRATTDLAFRRRLVADPRAAIMEFTGRVLPESFNVAFVENQADVTVVLPDYAGPAAELSESEMEIVTGGASNPRAAVLMAGLITAAATLQGSGPDTRAAWQD